MERVARLEVRQGLTHARLEGRSGLGTLALVQGKHAGSIEMTESLVRIKALGGGLFWKKSDVALVLASEPVWDVQLKGGVSNLQADFSALRLRSLEVKGGASNLEVTLGRPNGVGQISIHGGASHLQLQRPRRRPHAAGARQQQRVAQRLAKACELGARRGLREVQPRRGAAHVVLCQQHVQRQQEVQVEAAQALGIVHGDIGYRMNRFPI